MQDPQPDFKPSVGVAEDLSPGLRRILAPNPSPMTFRGTNTYLLGTSELAVIDPGPDDPAHLQAIESAVLPGQKITHIFVTHAHLDHSPLASPLANRVDAPVLAFGRAEDGRSKTMTRLALSGCVGGGEGVDQAFAPDIHLSDDQVIKGKDWSLRALHTPGHMANHLCFAWDNVLFSGDLVMGWASSLVSPPDGDLGGFMASLQRLDRTSWDTFHAGHGAPITTPNARVQELLAHRMARESSILEGLAAGPANAQRLARMIYTETPEALLPAASRNVLAHLIDLMDKSFIEPVSELSETAVFRRI
ncbi:MBL fold metallo-hydrolase [uncultured Pelagimonas sp.]|uniref:MBL fold metallo-hydrolase n=1 Tax=uncultured Pelagimonas sp. TaxID=1618102 RepID=UPI0026166048|nr:MBL fold metallo-hydrolase [uncultured Pelagimonas sp.]